jgi:steroid 5-alpha reductase family enzyme
MIAWPFWFESLALVLGGMTLAWCVSRWLENVSIVDGLWSLGFLLAGAHYVGRMGDSGARTILVSCLALIWGLRLSIHIFWRNHGQGEDPRYRAMRNAVGPSFRHRSWATVFLLQGGLLWVIAIPWAVASSPTGPALGPWDAVGCLLWLVGFLFEAVGDAQLAQFKRHPAHRGQVMDRGLWRWTRHPNYFGEATLWWGFYCLAVAAGGAWTIYSPILMTFLLLKVSGVALLEKTIADRRPAYRDYIARTSAFLPWPPRDRAAPASAD